MWNSDLIKDTQSLKSVKDMADTLLPGSGTEGAHFWKTEWRHGDDLHLNVQTRLRGRAHLWTRSGARSGADTSSQESTLRSERSKETLAGPDVPSERPALHIHQQKRPQSRQRAVRPTPHGRQRSTHNVQPLVHSHSHLRPQGLRQHKHIPWHRVIRPEEKSMAVQCNQRGKFTVNGTEERKGW